MPAMRLATPSGFFQAAAHESGRFQIILEQIAERLHVARIKLDGFFEVLAGLIGIARRGEWAGGFRAPAVRAAQPKLVFRTGWIGRHGLFQNFGSLFEIALHVVVAADHGVDRRLFRLNGLEDLEGRFVIGEMIQLAGLVQVGGRLRQKGAHN